MYAGHTFPRLLFLINGVIQMNKKVSLGVTLSAVFIAIAVTFSVTMLLARQSFNSQLSNVSNKQAVYGKIYELDSVVKQNYLSADEIDYNKLADGVAAGYMSGIGDKYAAYYSAEDYDELLAENSGKRSGLGINVSATQSGDGMTVVSVYNGSPANVAGVKAGDIITAVDGKKVSDTGTDNALKTLRADEGTTVKMTVKRKDQTLEIKATVSEYEIISVTSELIDEIGLIRISEFNSATVKQFEDELKSLQEKGIKSIMFDVRNNPGGTLDSVAEILDELLPSGPIVSATYADGTNKVLYTSDDNELKMRMAVIVNGETASAAELFAQALKDYNKAVIVGNQTYGKGVMQTTVRLTDGSAVKYTNAKFNPPKSENFNGVGVTPDVKVDLTSGNEGSYLADEQIQAALAQLKSNS